jgi:hypothetical protein
MADMERPRRRTCEEAAESLAELSENLKEALSPRRAPVVAPTPARAAASVSADAQVSQTLAFARAWMGQGRGSTGVMRSLERALGRPAAPVVRRTPALPPSLAALARLAG